MTNKSIFKSRTKEAEFWEKNFDKEFKKGKTTKVYFAKNLSETINVRFNPHTMNELRKRAHNKGLGATQLIRMWVLEKIGTSETADEAI
jgi:hypothetical protein